MTKPSGGPDQGILGAVWSCCAEDTEAGVAQKAKLARNIKALFFDSMKSAFWTSLRPSS